VSNRKFTTSVQQQVDKNRKPAPNPHILTLSDYFCTSLQQIQIVELGFNDN